MITRFAPSPTGPLHLGHAYSALLAHDMARASGGRFLLRIEDIDTDRSRPEWETGICDDLRWLGIAWEGPVMRQSERLPAYRAALDRLGAMGLLYPCTCTRRDIAQALSAPQEGVPAGPDGPVYPGTCRGRTVDTARPHALRLDMRKALQHTGIPMYSEMISTPVRPDDPVTAIGDIVLARKDIGTSYHLAVVVDDAAQCVTDVVRGEDLAPATPIHVILQRLLGLPTPLYHHHRLIRDEAGRRLAKRDDARAIRTYRDAGATADDIRRMVGL